MCFKTNTSVQIGQAVLYLIVLKTHSLFCHLWNKCCKIPKQDICMPTYLSKLRVSLDPENVAKTCKQCLNNTM